MPVDSAYYSNRHACSIAKVSKANQDALQDSVQAFARVMLSGSSRVVVLVWDMEKQVHTKAMKKAHG